MCDRCANLQKFAAIVISTSSNTLPVRFREAAEWSRECAMVIDRRVFLKSAVSYLPGFGFGVRSVISAAAERYPNRSVKVIVPFPPGGGTDVVARPVSGFLSRAFGQQFYIENKSGAGGNIGIEAAARSEPDGYTLLMVPVAVVARPHLSDLKVDPIKDLLPVIQLTRQPLVIAVHPSLG